MTSGRPEKDESLWRDLAASAVQQVADRIRDAQRRAERAAASERDSERSGASGSIGGELKRLMVNGIRATSDTLGDLAADRQRRQAERERREAERARRAREAPMRKARSRAKRAKAGAVAMGVVTVGMLAGTAGMVAESDVPTALTGGVLSVAAGAGTVSLSRRGARHAATADEYARQLGAASADAVTLLGESAYSVTLPAESSLAYPATRRLIAQRQALGELLPEIEDVAPELGPLARQTEEALAGYADRVVMLERARAATGGSGTLDDALTRALTQYEEGVEAHQALVEAAATVLAELDSADYGDRPHEQMGEAADRLQALAEGLRHVRDENPIDPLGPAVTPQRSIPPEPGSAAAPRPSKRSNRQRDAAD